MLHVPEDARASGAETEAVAAAVHDVSLGFERRSHDRRENSESERGGETSGSSVAARKERKFFGDDAEAQIKALSLSSTRLGAEFAMLLKVLRASMMEACDATKQHAQIYHDAHKETGMIVDANLRVAEEIAARTQTLSQNLTDLSPLRQRLDELEAALSGYERIADKILRKG